MQVERVDGLVCDSLVTTLILYIKSPNHMCGIQLLLMRRITLVLELVVLYVV